MSVILLYSDEIIANVCEILHCCKKRGGLFSASFALAWVKKLQGHWAVDSVNIASVLVRSVQIFPNQGKASDAQFRILIEKAKAENEFVLRDIRQLREARKQKRDTQH